MKKLKSGFFALVLLVLVSSCGSHLPDPVMSTPIPMPTDAPSEPQPEKDYQVRAWVALDRPGLNQTQIVYGKLLRENEAIPGVQMYSVVHYQKNDRRWPETGFVTAGENGIAEISFGIMEAGSEAPVSVDVYLIDDEATFHGATLFTPRC